MWLAWERVVPRVGVCGGRQRTCFTCDRQGADLHRGIFRLHKEYFGFAGMGTEFSWPRRVNPVLVGAESELVRDRKGSRGAARTISTGLFSPACPWDAVGL